jgi:predicted dehydrogenase
MEFLTEPDLQVVALCDVNKGANNYSEWGNNELRDKARKLLDDSSWGGNGGYQGGIAGLAPAKDVVEKYYGKKKESGSFKGCATYEDYRELLAKQTGIDAVIIGTPDHLHAPVAMASMRAGKHVFCQKPMTHSIAEARKLAATAHETGLATQVAIGNSASEETRRICEWIWSGAVGPVRQVVNWSSRPFWPQGIERPVEAQTVPSNLNWDLWLGPAPFRPFNKTYQPFVWRGWYDFGTGAIGDMGCYSFDTIFRALRLKAPSAIEGSSSELMKETFPKASLINFDFAARGDMPPVRITWYDGGLRPPRPADLDAGQKLDKEGLMCVGDKGAILCEFEGGEPRLIPASKMREFQQPPKTLPRSAGNHREWIEACKGAKEKPAASFEFSAMVTEAILLGNIAVRSQDRLEWDGAKVTNAPSANELLGRAYREGWSL